MLNGDGDTAHPDIAFTALKLVIEVDGRQWHGDQAAFSRDRLRDVDLAELGWQVVRFPGWWVLAKPAEFARRVERIVAARAAALS